MVPDFQPFKHPAKNVESPSKSSKSGPISDVEWVEEVVPVFGKINKMQKQEKELQGGSSALLFCGVFGCIAAGVVYRKNTETNLKENSTEKKVDTEKHKKTELVRSNKDSKKEISTIDTFDEKNLSGCKEQEETKSPTKAEKEKVIKHVTNNVEVRSIKNINEIKTDAIEAHVSKPQKNKAEKTEDKKSRESTINDTKVLNAITEAKVSEVPLNKRKVSKAKCTNIEDPEWITKIKTFKITKVPKQNTADICEHGAIQHAVDILENIEVEKAEALKSTIKTATGAVDIEGANISRLRITVVVERTEEESLAKTMTMKEFMVSMSNQIIEDAVARVKENCSMENIKHLAETIKKYRPESAEIKSGKSL